MDIPGRGICLLSIHPVRPWTGTVLTRATAHIPGCIQVSRRVSRDPIRPSRRGSWSWNTPFIMQRNLDMNHIVYLENHALPSSLHHGGGRSSLLDDPRWRQVALEDNQRQRCHQPWEAAVLGRHDENPFSRDSHRPSESEHAAVDDRASNRRALTPRPPRAGRGTCRGSMIRGLPIPSPPVSLMLMVNSVCEMADHDGFDEDDDGRGTERPLQPIDHRCRRQHLLVHSCSRPEEVPTANQVA